jgi:hypothetical protein
MINIYTYIYNIYLKKYEIISLRDFKEWYNFYEHFIAFFVPSPPAMQPLPPSGPGTSLWCENPAISK